MSLVTYTTTVATVSDHVTPAPTFTTATLQTLVPATPGQIITLGTPNYATANPYYTPAVLTYTITEYNVYLANSQGNIWTSLTVDAIPTQISNPKGYYVPGEKVFVVPCPGWRCWSDGAKTGLIIGVIFAALALVLLLCCLRRWHERNIWIAHGAHGANDYERWQNSHPGWGYHGGPPPVNLLSGYGLRPYVTPAQAEAALRGGGPAPAPAPAPKAEEKKEEPKAVGKKGTRLKLGAWTAG
jgi:hypothetical protein